MPMRLTTVLSILRSGRRGAPPPESLGDRTNGILPFQSAGAVQVKEQKSCTNTFWRSPCCVSRGNLGDHGFDTSIGCTENDSVATFAEDALVNDQLRDYWAKPAIREWAKHGIIGESLTMNVTKVINHYRNFIATANVDGNYDKRGLPDPLVPAFYFTPRAI
jgi:hypothetical protein